MNAVAPLLDPLDLAIADASRRHELLLLIRNRRARVAELYKHYLEALDLQGVVEQALREHDEAGRAPA